MSSKWFAQGALQGKQHSGHAHLQQSVLVLRVQSQLIDGVGNGVCRSLSTCSTREFAS